MRFTDGCVFVNIVPLRSVTVRFVLRELSIFLLCFDYAIERLGNFSVLAFSLLWPGEISPCFLSLVSSLHSAIARKKQFPSPRTTISFLCEG